MLLCPALSESAKNLPLFFFFNLKISARVKASSLIECGPLDVTLTQQTPFASLSHHLIVHE